MLRFFFVIFVAILTSLLWDSFLLLPFKLFAVLVHEFWHALLALISGALIQDIQIDLNEGGETVVSQIENTSGLLLTISAGYIGSAFTGAFLFRRAFIGSGEKITLLFFSVILAYMSYLFTERGSLAFEVGIVGSLLFLCLSFFPCLVRRYALLLVASFLILYSCYDLLDFAFYSEKTDAVILANYMKVNDWAFARSLSENDLSTLIAFIWSTLVLGIVISFCSPLLKKLENPPFLNQKSLTRKS